MEENLRSKLGFFVFFMFVIALLVGGFIFTKNFTNNKNGNSNNKVSKDIKIDKKKDYIYYTNESTISEEAEIDYKDVVINIKGQEVLSESLNKENKIYKNNIKYIKDQEIENKSLIVYNNDDLYSLTFRNYKVFNKGNYLSLIIEDYDYSCYTNVEFNDAKAYVFDLQTGKLLSGEEILNKFNLSFDKIKNDVKNYLISKQTKVDGVDVIKIDETLDNLKDKGIYINKFGKVSITYLVKTTQVDYNEVTEVN